MLRLMSQSKPQSDNPASQSLSDSSSLSSPSNNNEIAPTVSIKPAKLPWLTKWLFIELLASTLTLGGIYAGSTTALGALLYLISLIFWYWLTVGKRLWGLMPLNIATTFVASLNFLKAIGLI